MQVAQTTAPQTLQPGTTTFQPGTNPLRAVYTATVKDAATAFALVAALEQRGCDWHFYLPPSLPRPTPLGASHAVYGGKKGDGAGALPPPPSPPLRCSRFTSCLNNVIATRSPSANLSTYLTPSGPRRGADGGKEGGQQTNRAGANR
eukprot:scaffold62153_cov61-Phaeocystis_antarctica.AAC.18